MEKVNLFWAIVWSVMAILCVVAIFLEPVAFLHVGHFPFVRGDVLARLPENQRNVTFNRRYNERHKEH